MQIPISRRDSGGAKLNFEIIGGSTEPTNPKENTIWINTDQEITDWTISGVAPDNPVNGMIWIEINPDDGISIQPFQDINIIIKLDVAQQYINDSWIAVNALIYRNKAWDDSMNSLYIIKDGIVNPDYAFSYFSSSNTSAQTVDNVFRVVITNNSYAVWYTKNLIDLSEYSYAIIETNGGVCPYYIAIGVTATKSLHDDEYETPFSSCVTFGNSSSPYAFGAATKTLELSSLSSDMWLGISLAGSNNVSTSYGYSKSGIDIKNIKLVRV